MTQNVINLPDIVAVIDGLKGKEINTKEPPHDMWDVMILCTVNSSTHCRAIERKLKFLCKEKEVPMEVESSSTWTVIDVGRALIMLFLPEARSFYESTDYVHRSGTDD